MCRQYLPAGSDVPYIRILKPIIKLFFILLLWPVAAAAEEAHSQTGGHEQIMQSRMAQLQDSAMLYLDGNRIAATRLIPELYANRNFSLAWEDPGKQEELIGIIREIDGEGLKPEDYLLESLVNFHGKGGRLTDEERVDFDILLSESLVRLGYHLQFGKVDPRSLDPSWNLDRSLGNEEPAAIIQAAIDSDSIRAYIDRAIPRQPFYARYKKALADYRGILARGGWPAVPPGPSLKRGMTDPRVAVLRRRLLAEGILTDEAPGAPDHFDDSLEAAVTQFQQRHGLDADGVAGKQTLAAMIVPVEDRIDQIRANLERGRWVLKDIRGDFMIINIAGFEAYLVRDNRLVWRSRVMVGKSYRKTPVFRAEMNYLVFNPTWTVPPGILRNDILPKARQNPAYLREQRFEMLDREGRRVEPESLDWSVITGKKFPYTLRQLPGPENALGRIKFIFPNPYFVYLHDTPHKKLFANPERTFSSGCIRVENPLDLAELVLADPENWGPQEIANAIASGKTRSVYLPEPLAIMLLYWTVVIEVDGVVHFRKDIYDRDARLLKALDGEFSISLPEGLPEKYYNRGLKGSEPFN